MCKFLAIAIDPWRFATQFFFRYEFEEKKSKVGTKKRASFRARFLVPECVKSKCLPTVDFSRTSLLIARAVHACTPIGTSQAFITLFHRLSCKKKTTLCDATVGCSTARVQFLTARLALHKRSQCVTFTHFLMSVWVQGRYPQNDVSGGPGEA